MTTPMLLQGPRGRRLCLELAKQLDEEIRIAAFLLDYELDSGAGKSVVYLGSTDGTPALPPVPSPEEFAVRIRSLDIPDLEERQVQSALERTVESARYWQEPDGADVLASLPVVVEALGRLAERTVAAPGAQWWWHPRQAEQWAIDWRSSDDPAPLPTNPEKTLSEWARQERADEVQAARERPNDPYANYSGTWWSIPQGLVQTVGRLPAGLSLTEDSFGWEVATTIAVRGSGRVLEVQTAEDWTELCRRFPLEVTAGRRHDWFRATARNGSWVIPDWEKVASEWDAAHLTVAAYLNAAGRALDLGEGKATVIAGWNPGSTLWLNDVAREVPGHRQEWRHVRDADHGHWTRTT